MLPERCWYRWIDSWHYPTDPDTHDNEPWEWDGLLGIPTDSKKDKDGIPRQVYQDVSVYNEAIVVEPKANHPYPVNESIPIQVYAADNVENVDMSLNGADWQPLEGSGHGWWHGFFKLPKGARHRQRLTVRASDSIHVELSRKAVSFVAAVQPEHVSIGRLEIENKAHTLRCTIQVTDDQHRPIVQRKVYFGYIFPASWRESQGTQTTDAHGEVPVTSPIPLREDDHFVLVAAGTDNSDRIRSGDMRLFKLGR